MPNPPSGTVTFLFTDIEGSTRRWEEQPQAMLVALQRHDSILRSSIEQHGGYVFKTIGDAFCAAFPTAIDALLATLATQRALQTEDWGEPGPLRVRASLHTGTAQERDGDYFGQPLNRVARLLSAGHGGQTLLSLPTYELVRDLLPPGVTLLDMGEHRLKDLIRPERVYQVSAPDLPTEFPPLKTLDNRPNNLPRQATAFIGRERETAEVLALLRRPGVALVTLTGPGGTGKTRLALQVGADSLDDFEDGVWFVDLASITDPNLVVPTLAQTLGVMEVAGQPIVETLRGYLKQKRMLLVLDNFERVLDACSSVDALLQAAPRVRAMVTSRLTLRLYGEKEYPVSPLALPDLQRLPPLDRLSQYEAVRLFIERAQDVKPDFRVTNESAPAIAEICVRLDGLPLAIELAAARIRLFPPHTLLTRLQSRLKLLTGGARNLPARQQTLRNTIEWSFDLLNEGEKQLFRRLAVFQGGRTLEAIEAICNPEGDTPGGDFGLSQSESHIEPLLVDVLDGVESLVSKSLLKVTEGAAEEDGSGGESRFVMLETIHEFAREKLGEGDEGERMRNRHAGFFLALVEEAEPHLRGTNQVNWLRRLEAERGNLRAALDWSASAEGGPQPELGLRLASGLQWFWVARGPLSEARNRLERVLARSEGATKALQAKAASTVGTIAWRQGDYSEAMRYHREALALYQQLGDKRGEAFATNNVASQYICLGDQEQGTLLFQESLELYKAIDDKWGIALTLGNLGEMARIRGDYVQARALKEEALHMRRAIGDKTGISLLLLNLGHLACQTEQPEQATAYFMEGLAVARELQHTLYIGRHLMGLAMVASVLKQARRAGVLFGASDTLIAINGMPLNPSDQAEYEFNLAAARAQLNEEAWEQAWQEGRNIALGEHGMEGVIAFALKEPTNA